MATLRQTNFSAGELDPRLWGRTDLKTFATGLRRCRNFFVSQQGALISRPGTVYLGETKGAGTTKAVRLVPFVYSDTQTYVLEFGHLYVRFWSSGAQVNNKHLNFDGQTVNFAVGTTVTGGTSGATGYITAMVDAGAYGLLRLANVTGTFVDNEALTATPGAAIVNGTAADTPAELTTEWTEDDLPKLQWAQTGDILTLTHPLRAPKELRRYSHDRWELADISFVRLSPWFRDTDDPTTATLAPRVRLADGTWPAATGERPRREWLWKVTALAQNIATGAVFETRPATVDTAYNAAGDTDIDLPFPDDGIAIYPDQAVTLQREESTGLGSAPADADDYRVIGYNYYRGRSDVFGFVGQTKSRTFVDTGQDPNYELPPPRGDNPFAVTTDAPATTYQEPAAAAFFQERRVFAGTVERPATVWLSATGDYANFDRRDVGFTADQPLEYELASRRRETIRSLLGAESLLIFTDASVWAFDAPAGVSPTDLPDVRIIETGGAGYLPALTPRGTTLFITANARGVRSLSPSKRALRRWDANDLTTIARHLMQGVSRQLVDWTYAEDPYGLVWAVRADGVLLSLTLGEGTAWAWHDTGGVVGGEVQNVCAVPEDGEDAVYLVVKRTIDGNVKRYVERMVDREPEGSDPVCLDCAKAIVYTSGTLTQLTGLAHLEGEAVYVVAHGKPVWGPITVDGGAVPFTETPSGATTFYVGLKYVPEIETLDVAHGEARLKQKSVVRVGFEVYASRGLQVGPDFDHLAEWRQRQVADGYAAIGAATELVVMPVKAGINSHARAALRQAEPLPCTIVGFSREVDLGG